MPLQFSAWFSFYLLHNDLSTFSCPPLWLWRLICQKQIFRLWGSNRIAHDDVWYYHSRYLLPAPKSPYEVWSAIIHAVVMQVKRPSKISIDKSTPTYVSELFISRWARMVDILRIRPVSWLQALLFWFRPKCHDSFDIIPYVSTKL